MITNPKGNIQVINFCKINIDDSSLYIASKEEGLISIGLGEDEENFIKGIKKDFPSDTITYDEAKNSIYIEQLQEYFEGKRKEFSVSLYLVGTDFQKKVWSALIAIPYGKTISYKDLAINIDNPKAIRAVGGANNKNRIPIIIPCHRVIGSDGKLVGFGGGLHLKERLLNIEGIKVEGEKVVK